jgi:hypothetical protein
MPRTRAFASEAVGVQMRGFDARGVPFVDDPIVPKDKESFGPSRSEVLAQGVEFGATDSVIVGRSACPGRLRDRRRRSQKNEEDYA